MSTNFLDEQIFVAIDIETTGINPWENSIIEIGAVKFTFNKIIDKFSRLVKYTGKQDPKSKKIHQISDELIKAEGHDIDKVLDELGNFIEDYVVVFHNAPFDLSFIVNSYNQLKVPLPSNFYCDNLQLVRIYLPNQKSYSLLNLSTALSIEVKKFHRALHDANTTALIFSHLLKKHKDDLTSKNKLHFFLQGKYKIKNFRIKFPKDFNLTKRYIDRMVKQKKLIRIQYYSTKSNRFLEQFVIFQELLVFNQKIFIRIQDYSSKEVNIVEFSKLKIIS